MRGDAKRIIERIRSLESGQIILDKILSHVNPMEALRIVFTPENVEAAARGFGEGFARGLTQK